MSDEYLDQPLSFGSAMGKKTNKPLLAYAIHPNNMKHNLTTPTGGPSTQRTPNAVSPYLNYDPRFMQSMQPEFIFPEGAAKQRGRFELAFSQIGSSVMVGAAIGGTVGLYNGVRLTTLAKETGKLRRTQ